MGNGGGVRYRKQSDDTDTWRKPKESKKSKDIEKENASATKAPVSTASSDPNHTLRHRPADAASATPAGMPSAAHLASSQAALVAERAATSWRQPTTAESVRAPPPVATAGGGTQEDDEDDLTGFENLADAAAKVWDDLMNQKHASKKDFNALFSLGDLKDGVERAAKRAETLNHKAKAAASKAEEKRLVLEEACSRIEEKGGRFVDGQAWKLGDIAIRRGKGLCEISMVHHEADPPYFEVRMAISGAVVGTESSKLMPLSTSDQTQVRRAVRAYEEAKTASTRAEEESTQANEEFRQQHQSLTNQVETKLKQCQEDAPSTPMNSGPTGVKMAAPPGLPEMNMVRKWTRAPKEIIPDLPEPAPAPSSYPDMKGVKEDLRGGQRQEASSVPTPATSSDAPVSSTGGSSSSNRQAPTQPNGFPSFDDLKRTENQQNQARTSSKPANDYPSVNPNAAREAFSRPTAADFGQGGASSSQRHTPQQEPRASSKSQTFAKGPSAPEGFPSFGSGPEADCQPDPARRASGQDAAQAPSGPSLGRRASQAAAQAERAQREAQAAAAAAAQQAEYEQRQAEAAARRESKPKATTAADVWVCYRTNEGAPYYHNGRTGETVWVLPKGATAQNPDGTPVASQGPYADDPFADLRQKEEEMRQQREYWSQWYAQYSAWYSQQSGQQAQGSAASKESSNFGERSGGRKAAGGGGATASGAGSGGTYNPFYEGEAAGSTPSANAAPRGPPPPRLLAGVEDHAVYAIKSAILKEMEQMVDQVKPLAQRKKALRCLHLRWHPDKNPDKIEVAKSVFQFIEETKPWFLFDPDSQDAA